MLGFKQVFALLALACTASAVPSKGINIGSTQVADFVFLGQFENKAYYTDAGPYNWANANTRCKSSGMKLVAIESQPELEFLQNSLQGAEFHWTSGKQRLSPRGISDAYWVDTDVNSHFNLNSYSIGYTTQLTCVSIGRYFNIADCVELRPALCQQQI